MSLTLKVLKEATTFRLRKKISHLILHVTNECNFRCNHCFIDFSKKFQNLTIAEIQGIADEFNDLIWLDIGGGEPFIRDDLDQIVSKFNAKEISIPTNGWFTEKIISTLMRISKIIDMSRLIITISIDGFRETHDEIRNKKGSYDRMINSYHAIRKQFPDLRIKFNTVLSQRNISEIIDLMHMVKEKLDPCFHSILFLRGTSINLDYRLPPVDEIRALENDIFQIQQQYQYGREGIMSDVQRNYQHVKRQLAEKIIEHKTQVIPCLGGQAHIVIYANGDVAPCEILPSVESIREQSLREILENDKWKDVIKCIRDKKCYCTHDCNMVENILFNFGLYKDLLIGGKQD